MAPPRNHPGLFLCLLLLVSTATLSAASYSSVCPKPGHADDRYTDGNETLLLTSFFQISTGYFSEGADSLFSAADDDDLYGSYRSFSLFPHGASHTSDQALVHLTATLTLTGPRIRTYGRPGRRRNYTDTGSISFVLDGFYSSASLELCMAGKGTELAADGSPKHYPDVVLRLRVPDRPSLTDPFVTGSLEVSGFGAIQLLSYAEGDNYKYASEGADDCSAPTPTQPARGSLQVLGSGFAWCAHLKQQLVTSYRLEHGGEPLPRRMHVNQMQCTAKGAVRAYVVFSNDTGSTERRRFFNYQQHRFLVDEEAVVADGHWDQDRGLLCLRACRVRRSASPPSALAVPKDECGIRMSFWFPAVWTVRDRSVVAGMLWNWSQTGTGSHDGVTTASSMDAADNGFIDVTDDHRSSNLSDVKYSYNKTILEVAKKHYLKIKTKKIKGSFPAGNYTYHDFMLQFYGRNSGHGHGEAYPVAIGPVMVYGDRLAAEDSLSRNGVLEVDTKQDLLSVSYDIHYHAPPEGWVPPTNRSYSVSLHKRRISAEGVYDPKRGILCMVGCREHNDSTDCQILVTVKFASLDARGKGHGTGVISSLRDKSDRLYFDKIDIGLYGMYSDQVSEAISRMDLEGIMLVASTTLSCVFTVLQILRTKNNPEAAPATSITMLAILTLGYLTPLVLNFDALFTSRRSRYSLYWTSDWREVKEVVMRAPTLLAFVLQLRLLQLVWSGRRRPADQSNTATPSPVVSERIVLQICLPLYVLGGALAAAVHVINVRAANEEPLVVRIGGEPATIWEDLVSYGGLILDGFLLPQIILNASLAGSGLRAISPWFYAGVTMTRVMPHVYDVVRRQVYEPSMSSSDLYASPRGDLFGVAWDIIIPCGAGVLAVLVFLQQRLGGSALLPSQRKRSGGYEMVSSI
ncbi:uncharacterized protein LOC125544566 [Triticum urartu]|uniref:RING-type E3 ubiquitin transferase n=1 Tax=Triticum urartu TaxID=4572 RepID=A0A8R7PT79_TRIUA|nr:uncharacterized protein LOC125544566 [Triticum urartu]